MSNWVCLKCNHKNQDNMKFCPVCHNPRALSEIVAGPHPSRPLSEYPQQAAPMPFPFPQGAEPTVQPVRPVPEEMPFQVPTTAGQLAQDGAPMPADFPFADIPAAAAQETPEMHTPQQQVPPMPDDFPFSVPVPPVQPDAPVQPEKEQFIPPDEMEPTVSAFGAPRQATVQPEVPVQQPETPAQPAAEQIAVPETPVQAAAEQFIAPDAPEPTVSVFRATGQQSVPFPEAPKRADIPFPEAPSMTRQQTAPIVPPPISAEVPKIAPEQPETPKKVPERAVPEPDYSQEYALYSEHGDSGRKLRIVLIAANAVCLLLNIAGIVYLLL